MIHLRDVKRTFVAPGGREVTAVQIPRLDLARGERLSVTGPNGAGKTTLLHLLSGLLRADSGSVVVDGEDLGRLREAQLDRFRSTRIGYLLQAPLLLEGLTAEQNVAAAMLFAGIPRSDHHGRAMALLERFSVDHRARHLPSALSGGERQRVALARALAADPPLLLADEPTTALDEEGAALLWADLDRLVAEEGRTVVLVTHRPRDLSPGWAALRMEPAEPATREASP